MMDTLRFIVPGLMAAAAVVALSGCLRSPVPPPNVPCAVVYAPEGQLTIGQGKADDGDDVITARGGAPYGPAAVPVQAIDGPANAASKATAFDKLRVEVTARKRATAGPRLPQTFARTTGTSAFTVPGPGVISCQFQINSNALLTLMGGATSYTARAEIRDAAGATLLNTSYQVVYAFEETPAGTIAVSSTESPPGQPLVPLLVLAANPSPFPAPLALQPTIQDLGPAGGFQLKPGGYTVRYELEAEGRAARQTVPPTVAVNIDADAVFQLVTFP